MLTLMVELASTYVYSVSATTANANTDPVRVIPGGFPEFLEHEGFSSHA